MGGLVLSLKFAMRVANANTNASIGSIASNSTGSHLDLVVDHEKSEQAELLSCHLRTLSTGELVSSRSFSSSLSSFSEHYHHAGESSSEGCRFRQCFQSLIHKWRKES